MKNGFQMKLLAASVLLIIAVTAEANDDVHSGQSSSASTYDLSPLQDGKTYRGFIITYKDGSTERGNASTAVQNVSAAISRARRTMPNGIRAHGALTSKAPGLQYGHKLASGADLVRTERVLSDVEASAIIKQIADDPAVAFVEPEYMLHAVDDAVEPDAVATFTAPNDPHFSVYQWDYVAADGTGFFDKQLNALVANWGGANIQKAWSLADGAGVVIASLDTGVTNHPDLNLALANAGYDFLSDHTVSGRAVDGRAPGGWDTGDWTTSNQCGDGGAAENSSWHGTHVFGTAGGQLTNNGVGMAGTAFNAQVVPVRVLGHCGGSNADIADAITWASGGHVDGVPDNTHPANVISMSLGGSGECPAESVLGSAISGAIGRGVAVVVAAGNENQDVATSSPANCAGVVAVASTGITGQRAFYSNYGSGITLAAPGGGVYRNDASDGDQATTGSIWSAINEGTTTPAAAGYGAMAGTSQATPHVAGAVALMQSYRLSLGQALLTPAQVTSILKSSAATSHVSSDQPIGAGILDAYKAVQMAGSQRW
ncbi:S8 family serine peptidase [Dyella tabacisoli]|uniref:Protease n=1 Tax=Dyella tabacisoli TaxID=2282381 RepID=A0A369UHL8_9GAMM|nr:S8 family serine peptidase [Dyella tabacisoli]RDD80046.1 protease [Dyella tabacisoli]